MGEEIEIIKDRLNIADLVGERVALKKFGQHFKGLCPFHQEKTPSFIVSPTKGIWHCFGCSRGGDIFSFMQEIEQIDFATALKILAERTGVELKSQPASNSDHRQRLFELLELTAKFFHELLMRQTVGAKAREYLSQRGVQEKTMQSFQLGYAPKSWDTLQTFLRRKGFSPKEMLAAGVAGESERGTLYDRFRGRIIFPIEDTHGRIVAFGGRIAPWYKTGEEGKYVNSPETSLYEKRRTVYNLNRAKNHLRHNTPCLVVEGYMDVVMLVQAGYANVVASSGTAFTEEALRTLSRFTNTLHFAFDADEAGMKAALSATQAALAAGLRVATVEFPGGMDPADLALSSPDRLKEIINNPVSLVILIINKLKQSQGSDAEKYLSELLPLIANVKNPVQQGEMVQEIARSLSVPLSTIISQLESVMAMSAPTANIAAQPTLGSAGASRLTLEQRAIGIIIAFPVTRDLLLSELHEDYFLADKTKALYKILHGLNQAKTDFSHLPADAVINLLEADYVPLAEGLRQISEEAQTQSSYAPIDEGKSLMRTIKKRYLEGELKRLQLELTVSAKEQRSDILNRFNQITQELSQVKT